MHKASETEKVVDVEFEYCVRFLEKQLKFLAKDPTDTDAQKHFCRALHEAKLVFETIARLYGNRYRANQGFEFFLALAKEGLQKLQTTPNVEKSIVASVSLHVYDIH